LLSQETGLDIFVKHENHNPTGAFKVRGGVNLIGSLSPGERRGVITATTGNHGQSIALACRREGVPCTIVTPLGNNPEKNAAMRALGAELIERGRDFDEARETVEQMQHDRKLRYVHSANEPMLIAGVATYALERELDDSVELGEDELAAGVRLALRATHNLAEGAGAAPLAAAMKLRDQLAGRKVACVMSGGNIDAATLTRILTTS